VRVGEKRGASGSPRDFGGWVSWRVRPTSGRLVPGTARFGQSLRYVSRRGLTARPVRRSVETARTHPNTEGHEGTDAPGHSGGVVGDTGRERQPLELSPRCAAGRADPGPRSVTPQKRPLRGLRRLRPAARPRPDGILAIKVDDLPRGRPVGAPGRVDATEPCHEVAPQQCYRRRSGALVLPSRLPGARPRLCLAPCWTRLTPGRCRGPLIPYTDRCHDHAP